MAARLAALKGVAPPPAAYVVWRATEQSGRPGQQGYELAGIGGRHDEKTFEHWLSEQGLGGESRLAVSVLAIREDLDASGNLREGVLERRRGGIDGPYYGMVARVEFAGPARHVRRYRALRDGRLADLAIGDDPAPMALDDPVPPALDDLDAESFAGEDAAVLTHLGPGAIVLDRRAPSLFEDVLGLSGIAHVRRPDGTEVGCGIGWHGTAAFVLVADFPRHGRPLPAPPDLEAVLDKTLRAGDLIRHETRLDARGFGVVARRRGQQALVLIRWDGQTATVEPFHPGEDPPANEDQRRWISYAETYEARTILDCWRDGDSDDVCILTIDPDHEAWRHTIDTDGIEIARRSDNEAAAAVLYREREGGTVEGSDSVSEPETGGPEAGSPAPFQSPASSGPPPPFQSPPPFPSPPQSGPEPRERAADAAAPPDSLLAKIQAHAHVADLLRSVRAACAGGRDRPMPGALREQLRALPDHLVALNARFSAGSLRHLLARLETGRLSVRAAAGALEDLAIRLADELAQVRVVLVPSGQAHGDGEPAFGEAVERRFPEAVHDIEEAAACFAVRRATASVMHAANAMRHGLAALARFDAALAHLDAAPKPVEPSWARMIAAADGSPELIDALAGLRRVWRGRGPVAAGKYTEEEAEAILAAVGGFLRVLADRMDAAEA